MLFGIPTPKNAAIGLVEDHGRTTPVWRTGDHKGRTPEQMISEAIGAKKLIKPGVYVVSWANTAGVPQACLYTVFEKNDKIIFKQGLKPSTPFVHHWPPKT